MITAVDTCVLLDVFLADPEHGLQSTQALRDCQREGQLVACDAVWAEVCSAFADRGVVEAALQQLAVAFSPLTAEAAARAGELWRAYRERGGPRRRVAADFLIGGHAMLQADRLLTRDRGFYRDHFAGLALVGAGG